MQKVNELIGWRFSPSSFNYTAQHLFSDRTKKQFSESLTSLDKMVERLPEGGKRPESYLISEVYDKFVENLNDDLFRFNKREARVFIWALDYKPNENDEAILYSYRLHRALYLIKQSWRDGFIISLWNILMKNWSKLLDDKSNQKLLINLLKEKCKEYNGKRKDILKVSNNLSYFIDDRGPQKYANLLHERGILLHEAYTLLEFKKHVLTHSYFEYVAYEYIFQCRNRNVNHSKVSAIYQFLEQHNSKKTTLLVCSYLIIEKSLVTYIDITKNESIRLIGDPIKRTFWRHSDLLAEEQELVDDARNRLNMLLNKQFIDVFFEKLIEDWRRKIYWERFIDKIDDIIFVGSRANRDYLKNIENISKYVDLRYRITKQNQNTCALIMYSKDFVFVEFSDVGPLHIYDRANFKVNLNNINSMSDLKVWRHFACAGSEGDLRFSSDGKITHQGYWELRVNAWMRRYYYD